ncbi:MAG: dihydrolipoamide acyltransferase [Candidatus Thorarchaeota archaeon]|nr:MAG: dihydrolipoamide acyltransferase [Candidatus Thorarchaeota archaeon]
MSSNFGYRKEPVPKSRKLITEMCDYALEKHRILGIFEADVTEARKMFHKYKKQTGESISFTGWIAACLGKAVGEHKQVHALMIGKQFIIFDDVNINILIETTIEGRAYPINYILKSANEKSVMEINAEIRDAQKKKEADYTEAKENRGIKLLLSAPKFLRAFLFWRKIRTGPFFIKDRMGTVSLTSIGMHATSGGWAIPLGLHALSVAVGGISEKPGFVGDNIEKREYLSLTVTLDHDVIDGAPATRFVARFLEFLEEGYGIPFQ